jgi:hypothetical protein
MLLGTRSAEAYPQFQFSTDNSRCTMCHFSPAGGGLINGWGRDESADTISRGGDGSLLHGLWEPPEWLSLGGDFRGVLGAHDTESPGFDPLAFPMQAEIYTRIAIGDFSFNSSVGMVGAARPRDPPLYSRFASREHYIMWQPESSGTYLRAGRYYAPYGLRQVDMTSYVRRDLGYYKLEETYGASYGYLKEKWEMHLTAYTRDPILKVGPEGSGLAAMYEKRFRDDTASWGAQSKVHIGPRSKRYWGGGTLKLWLSSLDLLVLSEVDLGVQKILSASSDPILQGIGHLNLTHFVSTGVMLGTTLEVAQTDFKLRGKDRESVSLHVQYFPKAHWEVMLLGRYERTRQTRDLLSLLMLHYYL